MMPALLAICLVFMTFPDRVPGENIRETLFSADTTFNDLTVIENVVFEASDIATVTLCASLCVEHSDCKSFFYNNGLQACSGQPSSLDTASSAFSEPGSKYFKPVASEEDSIPVQSSCFQNATEASRSSAAVTACLAGEELHLVPLGSPQSQPVVSRQVTVDGHCMEDRWTWNSGLVVFYSCVRQCLIDQPVATQNCTSSVKNSEYLCK